MKSLGHVWLFVTPWTVAHQAPQSTEFCRQEYWSGLLFPSPGDLPNPGIEPGSPALQADALLSEPPEKPWVPNNWCFWTVVLEKTLESPLDCNDIKPVNTKENQLWIFTGRIDVEAGASVLCPPDMSSWLIGEDPDTGKGWRQKKKGAAEDEWLDSITNSMNIIWATSRRWWRTGKPSMLQCMGLQRVRHDLATEQQLITTQSPEWLKLKQKNIWFYRWNAKQVLSQSASASIAQ